MPTTRTLLTSSLAVVARAAPPLLAVRDPELQQRLMAMQAKNQRNGALVLGFVVAVCVWLFSVPPDIRRTQICELTGGDPFLGDCKSFSALTDRVASHYQSCGSEGMPGCVQFDFSIDPKSRSAFDAMVRQAVEAPAGDVATE